MLLTAQTTTDYFEAGVFAVDAGSGALLWSFNYDDLPIDRIWTGPTGVAANGEISMVTGFWSYLDGDNGDQQVVQAHTLGFDADGTLSCLATYDEHDPRDLSELRSFVSFAIEADGEGSFVLAGVAPAYFNDPGLSPELLTARCGADDWSRARSSCHASLGVRSRWTLVRGRAGWCLTKGGHLVRECTSRKDDDEHDDVAYPI